MIALDTVATLAKSFNVKREKDSDDTERVIAHLKFAECFVPRETVDELCRQPIGWSESCLFDELGAPRLQCVIGLTRSEWICTGNICGPQGRPQLKLLQAELDGVLLTPTKLGAVMSGTLSWVAKGDEVEDVTDMLGAVCTLKATLNGGGQQDLLSPTALRAAAFVAFTAANGGGSVEFSDGTKISISEKAAINMDGPRISSASKVMQMMQRDEYHLRGADPDYWLEHPGRPSDRHGVGLNAARSVLKRGLEPIGTQDDEVGRWRWKGAAA